ncbi:hypothetical protein ACJX0J_039796, partial [Zea mays]
NILHKFYGPTTTAILLCTIERWNQYLVQRILYESLNIEDELAVFLPNCGKRKQGHLRNA